MICLYVLSLGVRVCGLVKFMLSRLHAVENIIDVLAYC